MVKCSYGGVYFMIKKLLELFENKDDKAIKKRIERLKEDTKPTKNIVKDTEKINNN
jgi:hypothetical protein